MITRLAAVQKNTWKMLLTHKDLLTSGKKTLTRKLTIDARSCSFASFIRNLISVPVAILTLLIICNGASVTADMKSKIKERRIGCCCCVRPDTPR